MLSGLAAASHATGLLGECPNAAKGGLACCLDDQRSVKEHVCLVHIHALAFLQASRPCSSSCCSSKTCSSKPCSSKLRRRSAWIFVVRLFAAVCRVCRPTLWHGPSTDWPQDSGPGLGQRPQLGKCEVVESLRLTNVFLFHEVITKSIQAVQASCPKQNFWTCCRTSRSPSASGFSVVRSCGRSCEELVSVRDIRERQTLCSQ